MATEAQTLVVNVPVEEFVTFILREAEVEGLESFAGDWEGEFDEAVEGFYEFTIRRV